MKLPNIDFMMNMTKEFLDGKIDSVSYSLDFPYELKKRYKKIHQEDDDYCYLIYEDLYKDGVARFDEYFKISTLNKTLKTDVDWCCSDVLVVI